MWRQEAWHVAGCAQQQTSALLERIDMEPKSEFVMCECCGEMVAKDYAEPVTDIVTGHEEWTCHDCLRDDDTYSIFHYMDGDLI